MVQRKLADDSTIRDVVRILDNPVEYVRGVFGNMLGCKTTHGSAFVRIGTTGRGISPHYRVEPAEAQTASVLSDLAEGLDDKYFTAYHGRNYKQLDWGFFEVRGEHWSTRKMGYDDVQLLLGELRGFKGKGQVE